VSLGGVGLGSLVGHASLCFWCWWGWDAVPSVWTTTLTKTETHGKTPTASVLLLGREDGCLALWDTRAGTPGGGAQLAARLDKAHKTRLRAIVPITQGENFFRC
jgi:hypothetical protein